MFGHDEIKRGYMLRKLDEFTTMSRFKIKLRNTCLCTSCYKIYNIGMFTNCSHYLQLIPKVTFFFLCSILYNFKNAFAVVMSQILHNVFNANENNIALYLLSNDTNIQGTVRSDL